MASLLDRSKLERAKALKNERMESILEAGLRAFLRFSYPEVTLDSVRKLANVPEGKPELYFGSREELFLKVLSRQSQAWTTTFRNLLRRTPDPLSPEQLAAVLTNSVTEHPEFCHLRALLPMVLEHIIDVGAVTIFFASINGQLRLAAADLTRKCPRLGESDSVRLVVLFQTYASSLHQLAEPSRALARLSAAEGADGLVADYDRELAIIASDMASRFAG